MILLGVHGPGTPTEIRATYPLTDATREFKGGVIPPQNLIPSFENLCRPALDDDMHVVVSFKPRPDDVTNGAWQLYIEQLARHINVNELADKVTVVFWHEPEDDTRDSYPNGTHKVMSFGTAEDFVRYFNTLHAWVKGVDPNIVTCHAALGYGYRPKVGGPHDKSAWVANPDAWVTRADVHAIDIYSGRSFPVTDTLEVSPVFKRWLDSRPDDVAWAVAERGWPTVEHEARAKAITDEFAWLKTLPEAARPTFYLVWATDGTEHDPSLLLDTSAQNAINTGFALLNAPDEDPTPVPAPETVECPLCHGSGRVPVAHTIAIQTFVTVAKPGA